MNGQEWERFGEEIRRTVQNAVDTQDYTRMNQTITNVVNQALNEAAQGIKNFGESVERTARSAEQYRTSRNWKVNNENLYKASAQAPALYESVISWKAGGVVLSAVGYGIGGSMLLLFLIILLISAFTGNFGIEYQITMVIAAILAGICGVMAWQGTSILGRIKRFKTYIRTLNGREYCDVKELEGAVRKSFKFVIKDLEKMIAKGWFRQGHLDQKKSCFMVSNQMYGQYLQLEEQMRQREEQRRQEEKKAQEEGKMKQSKLDPEVQKIIEQGKDYVRKIRQCNDAIPGEEISAKISRMEMLVGRILTEWSRIRKRWQIYEN